MSQHTPGPWHIRPDYGKENVYRLWNQDDNYPDDTSPEVMDANACIMAAALDLLAALESIAANTCCDSCQEAKLVAQKAIAKAKGMPS